MAVQAFAGIGRGLAQHLDHATGCALWRRAFGDTVGRQQALCGCGRIVAVGQPQGPGQHDVLGRPLEIRESGAPNLAPRPEAMLMVRDASAGHAKAQVGGRFGEVRVVARVAVAFALDD